MQMLGKRIRVNAWGIFLYINVHADLLHKSTNIGEMVPGLIRDAMSLSDKTQMLPLNAGRPEKWKSHAEISKSNIDFRRQQYLYESITLGHFPAEYRIKLNRAGLLYLGSIPPSFSWSLKGGAGRTYDPSMRCKKSLRQDGRSLQYCKSPRQTKGTSSHVRDLLA